MRKTITLFMIGFICLTGFWIATDDVSADVEMTQDPIYINSNANFASQAVNETWAGDGTEANPYIIENYDINASNAHGIHIENIDVYFIIRNCTISNGWTGDVLTSYDGICFSNVAHGTIENVTSNNNYCGIRLWNSSYNRFNRCIITNNNQGGISLYISSHNTVSECNIIGNSLGGIYLERASNNIFNTCIITNNEGRGAYIRVSLNITFSGCNFANNKGGVFLWDASYNAFDASTITDNEGDGVFLWNSSYNTFIASTFSNNSDFCFFFYASSNSNHVTMCNISNNKYGAYFINSSYNNFRYCNIYGNVNYGIYNNNSESLFKVDATYCLWSSNDGPGGNGPGSGDNVSGNVLYDPWLKGEVHDPISIRGNENFTLANGVTSGSGTAEDPYIIEDENINAVTANGIEIRNTDVYFIIRNCVVHNGYEEDVRSNYGIYFYNVTNGGIDSVISENNYYGIFLQNSLNNTIINSNCSNNNEEGIHLFSSSDNKILNCAAYNNFRGIGIYSSDNNNITGCMFYENHYYGIIFYSSNNNQITDSLCYKNDHGSIYFENASNNIISNSTCSKSVIAIHLSYYSSSNTIKDCNISGNANGVKIVSSSNSNFIYNNILDNVNNAYDECSNYWNSSSEGNYWSDYNGTDEYFIPGGNNKDSYPSGIFKKETKIEEEMPIMYPALVCIAIILVCIMLYGVIETKIILIRCPACGKTVRVKKKVRPFNLECKHCGRKGVLR